MARTVLVVDDEADIREILEFNLQQEQFTVLTAANGLAALKKATENLPDIILLDVMMDGMDGMEVLRELKANPRTAAIPVLFLTAKGEELDKVLGLELGADDYVTKPFSVREVLSRIKAVLRRSGAGAEPGRTELVHEGLVLNLQSKRLFIDGEKINLTKTEFNILQLFLENPGQVFNREQIKERAWDDETFIVDRAVDVHIRRLRGKLGDYASLVVTYPGVGYGYKI